MLECADDWCWLDRVKFGSGVARAIARRIDASGGSDQSWRLDYEEMARDFEFSVQEIRDAVALMIANDYARIEHNHPGLEGTWLLLLTPSRLRADAAAAEAARRKREERAAKIALRGGRVHRAPIPEDVKAFVFERDGHACQHCRTTENLTLDHVHPWSLGGADTPENLQVLCGSCNSKKGARRV